MADLGIIYFSSGFFVLFLSLLSGPLEFSIFVLGILSIIVLPYTLFSILYQAFMIHSWCILCLFIQGLFWIEFALLYPFVNGKFNFIKWDSLFPVGFGFGLSILGWLWLGPVLKNYPILKHKALELNRLRSQPDYIEFQFSKANKIKVQPLPSEIILGPQNAPIKLIQVINPFCRHCGEMLRDMEKLIEFGRGKVQGIVRFLVVGQSDDVNEIEKRIDFKVALNITAMAVSGRTEDVKNAIKDWFSNEEIVYNRYYNKWIKRYSPCSVNALKEATDILSVQFKWAYENSIQSTPTLFLNNLRIPQGITYVDLKYFLMRLTSHQEKK
jgi:hypothetical protein